MPIAIFGSDAMQAEWLPQVAEGSAFLTAAVIESGNAGIPKVPATVATKQADGWALEGEKVFVPWATRADRLLVSARTGDGGASTVFLVDPAADGVTLESLATTNGEPQAKVRLDGVPVADADVVGTVDGGGEVTDWIADHLTAGVCATQAGVCMRAVEMIGTYTTERHQFDSPIATFQAVAHRAADAYIDAYGVQFTAWQASWRLAEGLPADDALDVAKFWAADGGQRVVHAAQHLHGGIGVDKDYPLHRYFLWAKSLELTLGGATERLLRMGARLAAQPTG
jgi:alkylation response protein AidB-like acyl-CoA dehydrogenase